MTDVSSPDFWEPIYAGEPPWDLGMPAPPLVSLLARSTPPPPLAPPARVAVLGSGRGHDAVHLARAGFDVTGFDFARPAIEAATAAASRAGVASRCRFERRDVLALAIDPPPLPFDAAIEHTCFCAIDPRRRPEYVAAARALIRPGGLLVALFYPVEPAAPPLPEGPPFASRREDLERLFLGPFELVEAAVPSDSVERRRGREWLAVLRRRP